MINRTMNKTVLAKNIKFLKGFHNTNGELIKFRFGFYTFSRYQIEMFCIERVVSFNLFLGIEKNHVSNCINFRKSTSHASL